MRAGGGVLGEGHGDWQVIRVELVVGLPLNCRSKMSGDQRDVWGGGGWKRVGWDRTVQHDKRAAVNGVGDRLTTSRGSVTARPGEPGFAVSIKVA